MSRGRASTVRRNLSTVASAAEIPSFVDLVLDPELAPVALLDAAAHVLIQALVAENPEMLQCADRPAAVLEPVTVAAYRVVAACRGLHEALDGYRARVRECRLRNDADADDIPF
jgi:hypothetical protein